MLLCICEDFAVVEGNLEFGVLRVEIVLQTIEVAGTFPLAHREVVEQIVAAGLGMAGHLVQVDAVVPFGDRNGDVAQTQVGAVRGHVHELRQVFARGHVDEMEAHFLRPDPRAVAG